MRQQCHLKMLHLKDSCIFNRTKIANFSIFLVHLNQCGFYSSSEGCLTSKINECRQSPYCFTRELSLSRGCFVSHATAEDGWDCSERPKFYGKNLSIVRGRKRMGITVCPKVNKGIPGWKGTENIHFNQRMWIAPDGTQGHLRLWEMWYSNGTSKILEQDNGASQLNK